MCHARRGGAWLTLARCKRRCPLVLSLLLAVCAHRPPPPEAPRLQPTAAKLEAAGKVGLDAAELTGQLNKPLYKMQPAEVDRFLAFEQIDQPRLRQRVAAVARKNIGQPYELYRLGEFPHEHDDAQPLFDLGKSDCVVFAEHTYAMALSASWEVFF